MHPSVAASWVRWDSRVDCSCSTRDRTSRRTTPTRCRSCSRSPYPLGGNASTGAVPRYPSAPVLPFGNLPWKTFMRCVPPGSRSSPHGNARAGESAASRELPLGLGRQSRPRPPAVRHRVEPRDVHHRMVAPRLHVGVRPLGVAPVGPEHLTPPLRARRRRACRESRRARSRRTRTTTRSARRRSSSRWRRRTRRTRRW